MSNKTMLIVYHLFLCGGGSKSILMEKYFGVEGGVEPFSEEVENLLGAYEINFSEEHRPNIEQLYVDLLNEMKGVPYFQCENVLEALALLQEVLATALWKYHQNIGEILEEFVRNFDRMDVPSERFRLYEEAQKTSCKNSS